MLRRTQLRDVFKKPEYKMIRNTTDLEIHLRMNTIRLSNISIAEFEEFLEARLIQEQ